jgi:YidC/Oxa1 family membrane protein insertase
VETRRLFLAAMLSLAVILVWSYLFPPKPHALPPKPAGAVATPAGSSAAGAPNVPNAPNAPNVRPGVTVSPAPAFDGVRVAAEREERVELRSGTAHAVFSNRGAQLVSFRLDNQRGGTESEDHGLELVRPRAAGPYPYGLTGRGVEPHPLDKVLYQVQRSPDGRAVVFRYAGPEGTAEKRFTFDDKGLIDALLTVHSGSPWSILVGPGVRNLSAAELASRYEQHGAVYRKNGSAEFVDAKGDPKRRELSAEGLDWVGLDDTYFVAAVVPRSGVGSVLIQPVLLEGLGNRFSPAPAKDQMTSEQKDLPREYEVLLRPQGESVSLLSYWGTKEYGRLAALPYHLEETIRLGSLGILARPLLTALHWIHDHVVDNYGWAIILVTVLIKLVLLPLTHKSTVSMRKMQDLNPKVQGIRERYRTKLKDKQGKPNLEMQRKMNEEVMALYKESGVNPAGGCLPLLLQMPILIAFYRLLTQAVELRGAPWILWLHDLSSKDPYYILPIVMGLTQFLQIQMSPQTGDPMQRRMFQLMPIFMTVLFLGYPSGLVLYWLTNNVLTIIQQGVYNHLRKREEARA